ncbi:MAG: sigma-70 family RNA polymerase sigma factor [Actinomycetota bacterium]|nr:sigma-70 family RNA polymerase sigma factor [Actinomycetota bacterium]
MLLAKAREQALLVAQQSLRRERQTGTTNAGEDELVSTPPNESVSVDDLLVEALSRGDEDAFAALIDRYHASLLRVARLYVSSHAVAEEVVQETWLGFLGSLARFERRCSLKTWLFTILIRCAARTRDHERRSIPFSAAWNAEAAPSEPALEPERFFPSNHRWRGIWRLDHAEAIPTGWADVPEDQLLNQELRHVIGRLVADLPLAQREVFTLRDIEGLTTEEVSNVLRVTANNQRVLLHRARSRVRRELERYLRTP